MVRERLRVRVCDAAGRPIAAEGLGRWLARVAPARAHGVVTVAIVSDARVRALNRQFRRIDRATDVLSFPAHATPVAPNPEPRRTRTNPAPDTLNPAPVFLGDIVIAAGVSRRQARAERHRHAIELRLLALHGLLHLLGYDHEHDDGRMRVVEARLRRKGGLPPGLIERAAASRKGRARKP
jgi:probable rRNA maturation factor